MTHMLDDVKAELSFRNLQTSERLEKKTLQVEEAVLTPRTEYSNPRRLGDSDVLVEYDFFKGMEVSAWSFVREATIITFLH